MAIVEKALLEDSPCRTCQYAEWDTGCPKTYSVLYRDVVVCRLGCFEKGIEWRLRLLPTSCRYYKRLENGEENMGLLDFSGKSQRELEEELRKIRDERTGRGKVRRRVVRDKRIKSAVTVKGRERRASREVEAEEI